MDVMVTLDLEHLVVSPGRERDERRERMRERMRDERERREI